MQVRAGLGVHGAGVEVDGVHERQRHRGGRAGHRQAFLGDPPQIAGKFGGGAGAEPAQIVEPDHRVGAVQVDIVVQITQQPVGQRIGQRTQLLLGVFDDRPQRRLTGGHLRPAQAADGQRHRVFGGEPADRAGQIDAPRQLLVPAVAFDADADGCTAGAQELRPGQPERDQQNVLHASVKRCWHLTQQQAGGLDVELRRELLGGDVGVHLGPHRGQRGWHGCHSAPRFSLLDYRRALRVFFEQ